MMSPNVVLEAGAGTSVLLLIGLLVSTVVYFVPSMIAAMRGHHQIGAVVAINLFLGWSLIGWVVALAMALSAKRRPQLVQHFPQQYGAVPPHVPR